MERLRKFEKKNSKKQYARAADSYSDESNVSDDDDRSASTESSTSTENASDFEPDDPNSDSRGDDGDEDGLGLPVQEGAELSNYPSNRSNYAPIRPRHTGKYILRPSTGPVIPDTADTVTMTNASAGGASTDDAVEMVNEIHVF